MLKKILIGGALLLVVGLVVGYFIWNTPHRDINSEKADYVTTVAETAAEFEKGAAEAEKKYTEKVVEFSGEVSKVVPGDSITSLLFTGNEAYGILCEMLPGENEKAAKVNKGDKIKVKAFYKGYMEGEPDFGMAGDILFKKGVIVE